MPWRVTGAAGAFIGSFFTGYVPFALLLTVIPPLSAAFLSSIG